MKTKPSTKKAQKAKGSTKTTATKEASKKKGVKKVVKSGEVTTDEWSLVTLRKLNVSKTGNRIAIRKGK